MAGKRLQKCVFLSINPIKSVFYIKITEKHVFGIFSFFFRETMTVFVMVLC